MGATALQLPARRPGLRWAGSTPAQHPYETAPGRPEELDPVNLNRAQKVLQRATPIAGLGSGGLRPGNPLPLSKGELRGSEAQGAWGNFLHLGLLYLGDHMPIWARKALSTGLLAPLIKKAAPPGVTSGSRPTNARESAVPVWIRAEQRTHAPVVAGQLGPQQLGAGVKDGVQVMALGGALSP